MIKVVVLLSVCLIFWGCDSKYDSTDVSTVLVEGHLLLQVAKGMHFKEGKGIDSYEAYIINTAKDTIYVEYGDKGVVNALRSEGVPVFPMSQKEHVVRTLDKGPSSDDVHFSDDADEDREEKIFDKNYYMYDTINDIIVKVVQPKRIGDGITGLFIPHLNNGKSASIYARNLDSSADRELLKIFRSIKYKN